MPTLKLFFDPPTQPLVSISLFSCYWKLSCVVGQLVQQKFSILGAPVGARMRAGSSFDDDCPAHKVSKAKVKAKVTNS